MSVFGHFDLAVFALLGVFVLIGSMNMFFAGEGAFTSALLGLLLGTAMLAGSVLAWTGVIA